MALEILLKSDVGLMSLITIGGVLCIGAYFFFFVRSKMREQDRQKRREKRSA